MWFSLSLVFFCPLLFSNRTFLFVNALSRYSQSLRYLVIASVAIVCFCATNRPFFRRKHSATQYVVLRNACCLAHVRFLPLRWFISEFLRKSFQKHFSAYICLQLASEQSLHLGGSREFARKSHRKEDASVSPLARAFFRGWFRSPSLGELARSLVYTRSVLR